MEEKGLVLIKPEDREKNVRLEYLLGSVPEIRAGVRRVIRRAEDLHSLKGERILFAIGLNDSGILLEWIRMLDVIRKDRMLLEDCVGGVIVDSPSELYSKAAGREAVLSASLSGCLFPGRPLVEGTGSLYNYHVQAELANTGLTEAYRAAAAELAGRLQSFSRPVYSRPKLLLLHASIRETSNTLRLWNMVRAGLGPEVEVQEISLQNGAVHDCVGCPFTTCMHFARQGSCFYGGVVVEQLYPALDECQGVLFLCPNYNDALSANLSAAINRLTSLYRVRQFYEKYLYGIVVSGYSGGDIVAEQLISSLNMNKTFLLPPRFVMMETANDPGSILKLPGIEERAAAFGEQIRKQMCGGI